MGIDKNILKNTNLILFNMEGKKNITNNNMKIQIKNYVGQPNFNAKLEIFNISEKTTLQNMDKNKPKYLFEWTDYNSKVKPFYDIDVFCYDEKEFIEKQFSLKCEWIDRLTALYPDGKVSIAQANGKKVKVQTKNKVKHNIDGYAVSYHFVINGYETTIPELREFNEKNNLYDYEGCDKSVYRDGGNMRLLYSMKPDDKYKRVKKPDSHHKEPLYHLIQSNEWSNIGFKPIPSKSPPVSPTHKPNEEEVIIDDEVVKDIIDKEIIIKKPKIKYDLGEVAKLVEDLSVDEILNDYNDYLYVGMALHNITNGDEIGLGLFKKFHSKYQNAEDTKRNPAQKWKSFGSDTKVRKVGITTLRKFHEKLYPPSTKTLKEVYRQQAEKDMPDSVSEPLGKQALLKEMNNRIIFVKETGEFIILDKQLIINSDGVHNYKPCWYLKNTTKAREFFQKEKFVFYNQVDDKKTTIDPFKIWSEWIGRREVRAIGFDPKNKENPDIFNLWNGFNISKEIADMSDEKDAQPILDHILNLWCRGNEEHYNYILNLFAHYIQKPHIKTGILLALKGKQGCGKGIILAKLQEIIGNDHYVQNSNANNLFGDFNGQLEAKIVVNLDEAYWGGDKKMEGVIKNKITEKNQTINKKNKEAYSIDCYANYIITTNNDWFAGTTEDDRRHYCLEVADAMAGRLTSDKAKIVQPVLDAPAEAFAKILYNRDITDYNPRIFKKTPLLQDQVERNWNSVKAWFHQSLKDGGFTDKRHKDGFTIWNEVPCQAEDYHMGKRTYGAVKIKDKKTKQKRVVYCKDYLFDVYNGTTADGRKMANNSFYRELKKNCLGKLYQEIRPNVKTGNRPSYIVLPSIDEVRQNWNEIQEYDYDWDDDDDWEIDSDSDDDE
jgi:hypothetical protein